MRRPPTRRRRANQSPKQTLVATCGFAARILRVVRSNLTMRRSPADKTAIRVNLSEAHEVRDFDEKVGGPQQALSDASWTSGGRLTATELGGRRAYKVCASLRFFPAVAGKILSAGASLSSVRAVRPAPALAQPSWDKREPPTPKGRRQVKCAKSGAMLTVRPTLSQAGADRTRDPRCLRFLAGGEARFPRTRRRGRWRNSPGCSHRHSRL